uniref:Uncharacterized protein n=1 Tax=Caldiarchaeum subterraneum TaxID=311458 RepID=E6NAS9_CALS0|nr:hypothetical protein HGMM_F15D08C26 [Candidatus Caldarchaeum subterraneum]
MESKALYLMMFWHLFRTVNEKRMESDFDGAEQITGITLPVNEKRMESLHMSDVPRKHYKLSMKRGWKAGHI